MSHPTRIFETPEELEAAFEKYKEDLEKRSGEWGKVQYVGKDGIRVEDPVKLPYTFEGLKRFCRKDYGCIEQYFNNKDELYDNFVTICRAIKNEIRENQITGGMIGNFNPSITQRLNGLKETMDTTVTSVSILTIDPMADDGKN